MTTSHNPNDGIFAYLSNTRTVVPSSVIGLSFVHGWSEIEPAQGQFNWQPLDDDLAYAQSHGKKAMLRVIFGHDCPAWVQAQCPTVGPITWKPGGPQGTQQTIMPIPWTSEFIAHVSAFIAAYGARYNGHATLARLPMPGCGWLGEMGMPHPWSGWTSSTPPPHGCGADTYTDARLENAWNQIVSAYVTAFPHTQLTLADDGATGIPPQSTTLAIRQNIATHAINTGAHIAFQANGLKSTSTAQYFAPESQWGVASGGGAGLQAYGSGNNSAALIAMANVAGQVGVRFLEIYAVDCENSANASALSYMASKVL